MKTVEQRINYLNDRMNHVELINKAIDKAIEKYAALSLNVKREGDVLIVRNEYKIPLDLVEMSKKIHEESYVDHFLLELIEESIFGKQSNWGTE